MDDSDRTFCFSRALVLLSMLVVELFAPRFLWAISGALENPLPGSFQSGIGLISGWVCEASRVDIELDGSATLQAGYGTDRGDTTGICGDANNGFGLLFNWNLFGNGRHTVRALADGQEFGRASVSVASLGSEFRTDLSFEFTLPNFPRVGRNTRLVWETSQQNLVVKGTSGGEGSTVGSTAPSTVISAAVSVGVLENPPQGSFQSGIGLISGWVCEAGRVDIEFDGGQKFLAAYGTDRRDTAVVCGDTNNGFGLLFNWNLSGDGRHTVRALADGQEFSSAEFTVVTLREGEFVQGQSGGFLGINALGQGEHVQVTWQENRQNFIVAGFIPSEGNLNLCAPRDGPAPNASGGQAMVNALNPCPRGDPLGDYLFLGLAVPSGTAATAQQEAQASSPFPSEGFFACEANLSFVQAGREFRSTDFQWLDPKGNQVCQMIKPGEKLSTSVVVNRGSALAFNKPFQILYAGQQTVDYALLQPVLEVSTSKLEFGQVPVAGRGELSFVVTNKGGGRLEGSATIASGGGDFSIVSGGVFGLDGGQSQTVKVRFSPSKAGEVSNNMAVVSGRLTANVNLHGTGR
jgi:hypothetical protein